MRQAIVTRYLAPTTHRGARIRVIAAAGDLILPWQDALDVEGNHAFAARKFAANLGWLDGQLLVGGSLPGSICRADFAFVLIPKGD